MSRIQMLHRDDGWYFIDRAGFLHGPFGKESDCYESALEREKADDDEREESPTDTV